MKKEYEVWMEGYSATGEHSGAQLLGRATAESFDEACVMVAGNDLDKDGNGVYKRGAPRGVTEPGLERTQARGNYSIWACQLFDNEADARKSFG